MIATLVGAAASALLLALFARLDPLLVWLGWVSLVPFMATQARARRVAHVVTAAWLLTVLFTLAVFGWFASAMADYVHRPRPLGWLVLFAAAPLLQPQFVIFALTRFYTRSSITAICAWMTCEWLYPKLFHDTLGYAMHPIAAIRQCADISGVALLTLLVLVVNAMLAHRRLVLSAIAVAVVAIAYGYGAWRSQQPSEGERLRVGLVQANLTDYEALRARLGTYDAVREILDAHEALSREALAAGARLVVWPETVYPTTFGKPKSEAGRELDDRLRKFPASLVFGAYDRDDAHEYNAAVILESGQIYHKNVLFPLTEGAWTAGTTSVVADGMAPLICFDVVDARLARRAATQGARLFVTLSNDAWFQRGLGPELHLVVAAFRSVETHLPQARATTTGVSALIDAHGEILARTQAGAREVLVGDLTLPTHAQPAGTWLEPALALLLIVLVAIRRASQRVAPPPQQPNAL